MSVTVQLEPEIEYRLKQEAVRSGESVDAIANRILDQTLPARPPFVVKPFDFELPEKYRGLTPRQMIAEMDVEEYEEKVERTRHESSGVRL